MSKNAPPRWENFDAVQRAKFEMRFWSQVDRRGPDDCWPWTGRHGGASYGRCSVIVCGVRISGAHRISCWAVNGPPPSLDSWWHAAHKCDNPPCVNPAHIEWLHRTQNMRDAFNRGRSKIGVWFSREWRTDDDHAMRLTARICAPKIRQRKFDRVVARVCRTSDSGAAKGKDERIAAYHARARELGALGHHMGRARERRLLQFSIFPDFVWMGAEEASPSVGEKREWVISTSGHRVSVPDRRWYYRDVIPSWIARLTIHNGFLVCAV